MKRPYLLITVVIAILAPLVGRVPWERAAFGAAAAQHEIRVTLFGQPCILSGPLSEEDLAALHKISPEQIPPNLDLAAARQALDRLKNSAELPGALDGYRTHLILRVEAQIAFLSALADIGRSSSASAIEEIAQKYVPRANRKAYQSAQRRFLASNRSPAAKTRLREAFDDAIEPSPEEEFHRAIERIGVSYACSFDDSGDESGDSAD